MCGMSSQSIAKWLVVLFLTLLSVVLAAIGLTLLLGPAALQAAPGGPHRLWMPAVTVSRPTPTPTPTYQGVATYYYATGEGACSFSASPADVLVVAMNGAQYGDAALCGAYLHVTGPRGAVMVRVTDLCPGCEYGDLDLSAEAFARIADPALGRVPVTWRIISPDLAGPIGYHFHSGSNQWWTAVQVLNHRNPVARLEYRTAGGDWVVVPRTSWNYFVQTGPGMGSGPCDFRVTDGYGNVLTDYAIPLEAGATVSGGGQFPPGP